MSNELVPAPLGEIQVYDRITDPLAAIKTLGGAIFKSGIFGLDKPEQGEILAMQCLAERKSPLELARTYHFIQGQLAIRSDALLAKFHQAGGTVEWTNRSDLAVVATFRKGKSEAVITATMKEYIENGTATKADGKTLKDNWKKWPRRMLTARAVSEGVRLIAPECCFGVYVAEEIMDANIPAKQSKFNSIRDIVIPEREEAAVEVLKKTGHLLDGQGIDDITPDTLDALLKNPRPFLAAVETQFNNP
jgi:hypothetical protein